MLCQSNQQFISLLCLRVVIHLTNDDTFRIAALKRSQLLKRRINSRIPLTSIQDSEQPESHQPRVNICKWREANAPRVRCAHLVLVSRTNQTGESRKRLVLGTNILH